MKIALVGYTGFVGSNLADMAGNHIQALYNSKNIHQAYGTSPDLLIYAGLRAEKYLANHHPEKDMELIVQAEENIQKIQPKNLVLISTIDVFHRPHNVDETTLIEPNQLTPYGLHRFALEKWTRQNYPEALIIRLPGLFGKQIKKNFIYDVIHRIPFMLKKDKMEELSLRNRELLSYYDSLDNGFYRIKTLTEGEKIEIRRILEDIGFSALHFTDSRSQFQFYNLNHLWKDLIHALKHNLKVWHPATEPIAAWELYEYVYGKTFKNELSDVPVKYNYQSIYAQLFGGSNGYIASKGQVLEEIKEFIEKEIVLHE